MARTEIHLKIKIYSFLQQLAARQVLTTLSAIIIFPVNDFLKPLEETAYLAKMNFIEPIYSNSCVYIPGVYNIKEEVEERATNHAKRLIINSDSLDSQN